MSAEYPLLQTKLHRPRLPKDLITRTRLVEQLNQDIDRPLIVVCAPAGFGKTTLVSNWLRLRSVDQNESAASLPAAWLSLDENDSDLNLFLRYFIAALRTIFSEACPNTLALLQARQSPSDLILKTTFINELAELPGEVILVLDDFHTIHGTQVSQLLGELMLHWPRTLHLVLISRLSPPITLSNLRARGMLSEIRSRDLRFTPKEMAAYLNLLQSAQLSEATLPLLEERFEGWPAGLHLAGLSLRSAGDQNAILSILSSENANITGYLVDEVLSQQAPPIHSFLLQTSILDRFCASLSEAVIGEMDPAWNSRACLDLIERSELFLIPLDDHREWYRYHHFFQKLLQYRLATHMAPDQVKQLHLWASAWFEEQGLIDEALKHALAAGDLDLAAHQMSAGLREALERQDRPTLERWLRMLPEEVIQQNPELLMVRAWAMEFSWRLKMQAQIIQQIEGLLHSGRTTSLPPNELQILRGQILALKAQHAHFSNQTALAIELSRQALALLPSSWKIARGGAMLFLGLSMQAGGQALEAEQMLINEYESYAEKTDIYAMLILQSLGFIYRFTGKLEQSRQIAGVLHLGAVRSGRAVMESWADWLLGVACYIQNNLEEASKHFTRIYENRYSAQIAAYRDAVAGLALIHQIKGESAEALQIVDSISQFDLELKGSEDERTRSLRARLMLLQGDLYGAHKWLITLSGPPPDTPLIWLEEPQVTRARILLAGGTESDFMSALQILDVLDEITERTHTTCYKIDILALRALVLDAQGETEKSIATLKQALELSRPGGFIRSFVDLGEPMRKMLQHLSEPNHSEELVERILAAFQADVQSLHGRQSLAQPVRQPSLSRSMLVEPLTHREVEVLTLLRGPSSIKEIAQQLHISYATAKRHSINIYAKLSVNQRWKAVAIAEELGILPPR